MYEDKSRCIRRGKCCFEDVSGCSRCLHPKIPPPPAPPDPALHSYTESGDILKGLIKKIKGIK